VTLFPGFGQRYSKINVLPAVAAYADLARRHGISLTRLALAFVASRPFVASTIIGATTMEQLHEDIDGCTGTLPEEVVKEIEALHLRYFNPAP
jgi:aryl-alcohol dehydrogenase (NADP+)